MNLSHRRAIAFLTIAFVCGCKAVSAETPLRLENFIVVASDEAVISATVEGPLHQIDVREGERVSAGNIIAIIDNREAVLRRDLAKQQFLIASENAQTDYDSKTAKSKLAQKQQLAIEQSIRLKLNEQESQNENKVLAAEKSEALAYSEWQRAQTARQDFADAVSQSEIDSLTLQHQRSELETKQARFEQRLAEIQVDLDKEIAKSIQLQTNEQVIAVEQAESRARIASLGEEIKRIELDLANLLANKHELRSPISGTVVELNSSRGAWVRPGQAIARVIGTTRLQAEGYADARWLEELRKTSQVIIEIQNPNGDTISQPSTRVFVSPEIDPVTSEVRMVVEFDNQDHLVAPGSQATIRLTSAEPVP